MDFEIKYRKFPIQLGQRLTDVPEYLSWKEQGWVVKWAYVKAEGNARVVETLLHRTPAGGVDR